MSCYTRHLDGLFERLGWEKNPDNKKKLDRLIRQKLDMKDAGCPEVGAKIKEMTVKWTDYDNLVDILTK